MKRLLILMLVLMLTSSLAFASGDKKRGTDNNGKSYTGSTANGSSSQTRSGR